MPSAKRKKKPQPSAILLYADSEQSADQRYFGKVAVPDAFVSMQVQGRSLAVVSALEFSRVVKESVFDEVLPLEEIRLEAIKLFRKSQGGPAGVIRVLAQRFKVTKFRIPFGFPAGLAMQLQEAGITLEVAPDLLFPQRARKSDKEAAEIRKANRLASRGFRRVEEILGESVVRGKRLFWQGKTLTSERVREEIGKICLAGGATASGTIVAGGDQGCDPHCRGSGPLRPAELIIVDIFPRLDQSGYHGDMTRTYLKGTPSDPQRRLVETVRKAQKHALARVAPGRSGEKIYEEVMRQFVEAGFPTKKVDGVSRGFFHGLGHGLGLEVHEPPRLSVRGPLLSAGHVVTVEPGLYYPGLGGCRIEDVVRVGGKTGAEMLSRHPYRWVIP